MATWTRAAAAPANWSAAENASSSWDNAMAFWNDDVTFSGNVVIGEVAEGLLQDDTLYIRGAFPIWSIRDDNTLDLYANHIQFGRGDGSGNYVEIGTTGDGANGASELIIKMAGQERFRFSSDGTLTTFPIIGDTIIGGTLVVHDYGDPVDDPSAVVRFDSITAGFLLPRMTTVERDAIVAPSEGLLIYNTTTDTLDSYTGSGWTQVGAGVGVITDHGLLDGLADDDHTQYHNDTRGDARYWQLSTDLATQVELDAHVNDATDAHDASAISIADAGGYITATDVEAALQELAAPTNKPYDVGAMVTGAPTASLVCMRYPFPRAVAFPSGMTNSQGVAGTAATAQTDFDLKKNGVSFGTMRFAAAGTVASFIAASSTSFAAGDILTVVAPASPDATCANVGFALAGTR